ncbi:hypothetical protein GCM10009096_01580 [Parasphingorhabdus litoris]|uniref:Uncharacterized protein n=1 Tax=Parasphingorhabdus litoris TaxID=394733 RepID=A0ABN1A0Y4_9SPHN
MRLEQKNSKSSAGRLLKNIRQQLRKQYGAEGKIRIVLEGFSGDDVLLSYATRKALHKVFIVNGRRTLWRLARVDLLTIRPVLGIMKK